MRGLLPRTHEAPRPGARPEGHVPSHLGRTSQQGTGPSPCGGRGCWTAAGWGSLSPSLALLPSRPEEPSTWTGYVGKMFLAASNYLPTQVSDMMNQDRAFATGRLGFSGHRNICTLATYAQPPNARQKPSLMYFPKCGMPQTCKRV